MSDRAAALILSRMDYPRNARSLWLGATTGVALLTVLSTAACAGGAIPTSGVATSSTSSRPSLVAAPTTAPPATAGSGATGVDAMAAAATAKAKRLNQNPGMQIYVRQGKDERNLVFGQAILNPAQSMSPNDRLMVASVTKPMVAVAVMTLVESGVVKLDDPVDKYLGDAVRPKTGITVEHLLSMTSGLPDYGNASKYKGPGTTAGRDLVTLVKGEPLDFEPGAQGSYVNTNYAALEVVLEKAGGQSLGVSLARSVFAPAGMKQSTLGGEPSAHGYLGDTDVTPPAPAHPSAAAGVVSNARDLGRFLTALTAGQLVKPATLAAMERERAKVEDGGYGLGLIRYAVPCGIAVGHFGRNDAYAAAAFALPETGRIVAVTANSNANDDLQAIISLALCA